MKKRIWTIVIGAYLTAVFTIGSVLASQDNDSMKNAETVSTETEIISEGTQPDAQEEEKEEIPSEENDRVYAPGPCGRMSVSLPDGWVYRYCPIGFEGISNAYGLQMKPSREGTDYLELFYWQQFGVCGTGLKQEETQLAGGPAMIGTYDNHDMWDFVSFHADKEGIAAQAVKILGEWDETQKDEAWQILDTLQFESDIREGVMPYFQPDSEITDIGLSADVIDISDTGAAMRFQVWDPDLASGELEYGEDYTLERRESDGWQALPTLLDDWAVTAVAYVIPKEEAIEWRVNWEALYGKLTPGDYRITKTINDWREPGDYSSYTIRAYFLYYGEPSEIAAPSQNSEDWIS